MTTPQPPTCHRCVRPVETLPHRCATHEVACPTCGQRMAGYARQVMDAAVAHQRACGGIMQAVAA